jgi:ADP-heptose:LPS heptosyltransferase
LAAAIRHIGVMRLSAMGDVALVVPVLRAFRRKYPKVKITVVTRPFFRPFFDGIDGLNFYAYDPKGSHRGLNGILLLFRDLRKLGVDGFADLHNVIRSKVTGLLFALSGIPTVTIDKGRSEKKALTRMSDKIFRPLKPTYERYADVFMKLGFPFTLDHPEFPDAAVLSDNVRLLTGEKHGKWIGIAPFAQHDSKVYPEDLMRIVISDLASYAGKIFLFGGGGSELTKLQSFAETDPNIVVVAGRLSLREEMALISNLDLMVSMDSGNAHIAAMLGIKVVTIWGNTHPYTGFAPFNQPFKYAITADRNTYPGIPTSVYGNKKVAGYEDAMRSISPESIVQTIQTILTGS